MREICSAPYRLGGGVAGLRDVRPRSTPGRPRIGPRSTPRSNPNPPQSDPKLTPDRFCLNPDLPWICLGSTLSDRRVIFERPQGDPKATHAISCGDHVASGESSGGRTCVEQHVCRDMRCFALGGALAGPFASKASGNSFVRSYLAWRAVAGALALKLPGHACGACFACVPRV